MENFCMRRDERCLPLVGGKHAREEKNLMELQENQMISETANAQLKINAQPGIIVLTGIMAAGKSTVARLLAQRFVRGVYIEADALQRMIVSREGSG